MIEAWQAAAWLFIAALGCRYAALAALGFLDHFGGAIRAAAFLDRLGWFLIAGAAVAAMIAVLK